MNLLIVTSDPKVVRSRNIPPEPLLGGAAVSVICENRLVERNRLRMRLSVILECISLRFER